MGASTVGPMDSKKKGKPDKWEIESWARTIIEAHEIMNDPDKMKYVKGELSQKKKAMRSVDDLIKHRNELATCEDEE